MRTGVITFPGSLDDRDATRAVRLAGADPVPLWHAYRGGQFAEAVHRLADGCAALGVPVTGGNVSFYSQTGTAAIHPTPVPNLAAEQRLAGLLAAPPALFG